MEEMHMNIGEDMEKMDNVFYRDKFPEHDPNFWEDLNVFIEALEERLLSEVLKKSNDVSTGLSEKPYEGLGLSGREKETLDRLIFWAACCGLKNHTTVIKILYENNLNASAAENIREQILGELQNGDFFQHTTDDGSDQRIIQAEKILAYGLGSVPIINQGTKLQAEKDSFMYGFRYAVDMLARMIQEYEVFEPQK